MNKKVKIKNIFGEKLDLVLEGNEDSQHVVIFVHGYGTDKDENFASFIEFSNYLEKDFLIFRFDLSGYGASEGEDNAFQFQKAAGDVDSVIRYARKQYPTKLINIIAHSLGTFVVSLLSPSGIRKVVLSSIVNSNTKYVSYWLEKRILAKGGRVDKNGISVYPRTQGAVQLIGKDFWRTLENFNPVEYIGDLGRKTDLAIFKPMQDEILEYKYFDAYKHIKNVSYYEVRGDHNFKDPKERRELFKKIKAFLLE